METIWKYPLEVADRQTLTLPTNAQILTVQVQNGQPCLWALVNPEKQVTEERHIEIFGTGHPVPSAVHPASPAVSARRYISTIQLHDGALVFHVFERFGK